MKLLLLNALRTIAVQLNHLIIAHSDMESKPPFRQSLLRQSKLHFVCLFISLLSVSLLLLYCL